jgi:hypothetical protein
MIVKTIFGFLVSNLPIIISTIALAISFFVMYQNYLKPFNLFILTSHYVPWVERNDLLCMDLSIDFFNSGMKVGLIENVFLEISNGGNCFKLNQRHIRGFNDSQKIIIKSFWSPFYLVGKTEVNQIVSFYSEYNIDKLIDEESLARLLVSYKKKPNSKSNSLLKKDFKIILNKNEILAHSNRSSVRAL